MAGVAYYFLVQLGISLSSPPEYIATIWPPNAIILAALLLTERRYWWLFFLAMVAPFTISHFQAGSSISRSIIFYTANCAEIFVAALALKHFVGSRIKFDRLHEMIQFLLWAVLFAPALSAFIAAFTTFSEPGVNYWLVWRVWFFADALGNLMLTPVIILFASSTFSSIKNTSFPRMCESLILISSLIITVSFSLETSNSAAGHFPALLYIPIPILLWAALRFGPTGISSTLLIITIIAIYHTNHGHGPFVSNTPAETTLSLQLFLVAISIPMMLLSSLFSERKKVESQLRESNERFRASFSDAAIGMALLSLKGIITDINSSFCEMLGYSKEELIGSSFKDITHPDDVKRSLEYHRKLINEEIDPNNQFEKRYLHKQGHAIWALLSVSLVKNKDSSYAIAQIQNISKRKQDEESIIRFSRIFDNSLNEIYILDIDSLKFIQTNNASQNNLGYSQEELKEMSPIDINPDLTHEKLTTLIAPLLNNEEKKLVFEARHQRKDDSIYSVEVHLQHLKHDSETLLVAIVLDITERKQANDLLTHQASHDALTGLVNRREFERRAERLLSTVQQDENEGHALCFMDLDQFKVVNDTCGHTAGDEMLRQISSLLQNVIRHRDTLARLGGDEFGVLMEHCSLDDAHRVATSLQKAIQDYQFSWEGHTFKVGVSIGLVPITETSSSLTELLKDADAACYMAKDKGRNRIHVYHSEDSEIAKRHGEMQWVERIYQALDEDRFCLYAQTIAPLDNSADIHYEFLIRMIDEKGELIPPGAFLPAAERYNLISRIDHWVIEKIFSLLEKNPEFLEKINFCSINLSGQSLTDSNILDFITMQLDLSGIDGSKICFEITETAAISNLNNATRFISVLKHLGCQFALDDFGSGLSSFAYLKNLPVDYLKIDGMFVKDIVDDPIDHAMVKSINEIGHVMGMKTIAEFVENDVIKGMLKEIGVNYAQGYGIGKPQPLDDLLKK